jgi:hypothetical protein
MSYVAIVLPPGYWTYSASREVSARESVVEMRLPLVHEQDVAILGGASALWETPVGASLLANLEASLHVIRGNYVLRDGNRVIGFLRNHLELVDLALDAYVRLKLAFGRTAPIVLELIEDPESGFEELVALVQTELGPEDALKALDWLDAHWWLRTMPQANGLFGIDVEFR